MRQRKGGAGEEDKADDLQDAFVISGCFLVPYAMLPDINACMPYIHGPYARDAIRH